MAERRGRGRPRAGDEPIRPATQDAVDRLRDELLSAQLLAMLEAEDADRARRSLAHFFRWAWDLLEPGRVLQDGWHIDVMAEHLEAVVRGELQHLIINVPFRTSKSLLCSACLPVWAWLQKPVPGLITCGPQTRFFTLSNAHDLAVRDAMRTRSVIESSKFRTAFPDFPPFRADQNRKDWYALTSGGYRLSMGFDSTSTGRDGDIMVVDDPHDAKKVQRSDAQRTSDLENWDQKLGSRLTSFTHGAQVIVMQRLHPDDLTGHVVKKEPGKWTQVILPMEFDPARRCRTRWFIDPRTTDGELLSPARFPPDVVAAEKKRLGTYGTAAQLQQKPVPLGGALLRAEWFRERYSYDPRSRIVGPRALSPVQFWDTAQKDEHTTAYWVCLTAAKELDTGKIILLDVVRERWDYPTGRRQVVLQRTKWGAATSVVENKSTGQSIIQEVPGCIPFEPEGDKVGRLSAESPTIEDGSLVIPADDNRYTPWVADYLTELLLVPSSTYMDQADATSMMLRWFRERGLFSSATTFGLDLMVGPGV